MLRHLHISNLALIEELSLDFEPGPTVMTGETGAGKSILLDALALLAGVRATPTMVRAGAERACVEALLEAVPGGPAAKYLASEGLEGEEAEEVLLRREISVNGKGRAWINGRMVPVSTLAAFAERWIVFHAQGDQAGLLESSAQRDLLDDFAGLSEARGAVGAAYARALEARRALEGLEAGERDRQQRLDFVVFQLEELRGAAPRPGEREELEAEKQRLSHVEELSQRGAMVMGGLIDAAGDAPTAADLLGRTLAELERMAACDPGLGPLAEVAQDVCARVEDLGREVRRYVEGLEGDPQRLEEIEERLALLRRVLRKHGPTEADALARLEALEAERQTLESWESRQEGARGDLERATKSLAAAAAELTRKRQQATKRFVRSFGALLKDFALPNAQVEAQWSPVNRGLALGEGVYCGAEGAEELELMFSANPGEPMQALRKVASGGELSRIMLAMRSLAARRDHVPLLVLDEVDAGISGEAARRVAEQLAALGGRHQILYVTHQAAMAAVARRHLVVEKRTDRSRTRTLVSWVDGDRRREELARLLDGGQRSSQGLALAEEMLALQPVESVA